MSISRPTRPPASTISDGVVALRTRRPSDVDAIVAASHDPATNRWLEDDPLDPITSDADRQASVSRVEEAWRTGRAAPLIIADAITDEPLGLVNLQFRDDRTATIAYSVFPGHRGLGVATRAVELVRTWALEDVGVEFLLIEVEVDNTASTRVAEKCGFSLVDERVYPGSDGHQRSMKVYRQSS